MYKFCVGLARRLQSSIEFAKIHFNTQVYNTIENGVTTRGIHSQGVALVAEILAEATAIKTEGFTSERRIAISKLIAKALGIMHDLGHTPYGHDGEEALNQEMARFDAKDDNYNEKRVRLYGEKYAKSSESEVMCYEHNETSSVIGARLVEEYAGKSGVKVSSESLQYLKYGILAHSTSRVKEEPTGLEQQAVRLADKVAYIPQDMIDLLKQGIFSSDEFLESELELIGLAVGQIMPSELESYEKMSEQEKIRFKSDKEKERKKLIKALKNFDNIPPRLKNKIIKKLDNFVSEMQGEIARDCVKDGVMKGYKEIFDNIADIAEGKFDETKYDPKPGEPSLEQLKEIAVYCKELDDAQTEYSNAIKSKIDTTASKAKFDEATLKFKEALKTLGMSGRMATLWIAKHKYQDPFIKGKWVAHGREGSKNGKSLLVINERYENQWQMKTVYQLYYSNFDAIPDSFRQKYPLDKFTKQQVVSAYIASLSNEELETLYQTYVQKGAIVSREQALETVAKNMGLPISPDEIKKESIKKS